MKTRAICHVYNSLQVGIVRKNPRFIADNTQTNQPSDTTPCYGDVYLSVGLSQKNVKSSDLVGLIPLGQWNEVNLEPLP